MSLSLDLSVAWTFGEGEAVGRREACDSEADRLASWLLSLGLSSCFKPDVLISAVLSNLLEASLCPRETAVRARKASAPDN